MDERHGVDHLDSASGGHGFGLGASDELTRRDAKHGSDSLATGEERIAHSLVNLLWVLKRNTGFEGLVDGIGFQGNVVFETESGF